MSSEDFDCNILLPGHSYIKQEFHPDFIVQEDYWKPFSDRSFWPHTHAFLYVELGDYAEIIHNTTHEEQMNHVN